MTYQSTEKLSDREVESLKDTFCEGCELVTRIEQTPPSFSHNWLPAETWCQWDFDPASCPRSEEFEEVLQMEEMKMDCVEQLGDFLRIPPANLDPIKKTFLNFVLSNPDSRPACRFFEDCSERVDEDSYRLVLHYFLMNPWDEAEWIRSDDEPRWRSFVMAEFVE